MTIDAIDTTHTEGANFKFKFRLPVCQCHNLNFNLKLNSIEVVKSVKFDADA